MMGRSDSMSTNYGKNCMLRACLKAVDKWSKAAGKRAGFYTSSTNLQSKILQAGRFIHFSLPAFSQDGEVFTQRQVVSLPLYGWLIYTFSPTLTKTIKEIKDF